MLTPRLLRTPPNDTTQTSPKKNLAITEAPRLKSPKKSPNTYPFIMKKIIAFLTLAGLATSAHAAIILVDTGFANTNASGACKHQSIEGCRRSTGHRFYLHPQLRRRCQLRHAGGDRQSGSGLGTFSVSYDGVGMNLATGGSTGITVSASSTSTPPRPPETLCWISPVCGSMASASASPRSRATMVTRLVFMTPIAAPAPPSPSTPRMTASRCGRLTPTSVLSRPSRSPNRQEHGYWIQRLCRRL